MSITKHLADLTSYGHLLAYLQNDPAIEALIQVNAPLQLHEVADLLYTGPADAVQQIRTWVREDKIRIRIMDIDMPAIEAVHVIRLEPFYIFKTAGYPYV